MRVMLEMISAPQLDEYAQGRGVIIDLREPWQYRQKHIAGAVNIPFQNIDYSVFEKYRNRKLVLYCERGGASMIAGKELARAGYQVASVIGGIRAYRGKRLTR